MRILVTGGCGFIGSHQAVSLIESGHDVCIVDDLSNSWPSAIDRVEGLTGCRPEFHEFCVKDTARLVPTMETFRPDAVIHFAGSKHVRESVHIPVSYYENNVGGLLSLIRACETTGTRQLVFSSSGSVYGETNQLPINEYQSHQPSNPYSASKSMCERILSDLCAADDRWSILALRYFNPAGAHPSGKLGEHPRGLAVNLLPSLILAAFEADTPQADVYGDDFPTPDGSGVRDYVHVSDVADAHLRALEFAADFQGFLALNIGRGVGVSVFELITAVEAASGKEFRVNIQGQRTGDVSSLYGDSTLAQEFLGPLDYRSLSEICADAWRWQTNNAVLDERQSVRT